MGILHDGLLFSFVILVFTSTTNANDCNSHLEFEVQNDHNLVGQILCNGGYAAGYGSILTKWNVIYL